MARPVNIFYVIQYNNIATPYGQLGQNIIIYYSFKPH